LKYSFDMEEESKAIEEAVEKVLDAGMRTVDIMGDNLTKLSCSQMGDAIIKEIK
ncbi:MAG: isocitrate/isopropylmalate family dehydrogenase, partial [Erysipelotrichaceae bacterium]